MKELLEKLKDDFVGLADEEFPKGVSRERGQAMVLIAMCLIKAEAAIEAYIAEQIRLARRDEIKNQIKTLPAAVFIDDDRNAVENAAGAGLANYRYAIQMKLIDRLYHLSKNGTE